MQKKTERIFFFFVDPSGNSKIDAVYFDLESGSLSEVSCMDFEETFRIQRNWEDLLNVGIVSPEVVSWLRYE